MSKTKNFKSEGISVDTFEHSRPDLVAEVDFSENWYDQPASEAERIEKLSKAATQSLVLAGMESGMRIEEAAEKFEIGVEEIAANNPDKIAEMKADDAAERLGIDNVNTWQEINLPEVVAPRENQQAGSVHAARFIEHM